MSHKFTIEEIKRDHMKWYTVEDTAIPETTVVVVVTWIYTLFCKRCRVKICPHTDAVAELVKATKTEANGWQIENA